MIINQKGITHLLLLAFLITAVAIGTYLVQEKTSLIPSAQENDCPDLPAYCEDGQTRQCAGGYLDESGSCQRACEIIEEDPLDCGGETGDIPSTNNTNDSCSSLGLVSCTNDEADNGWVVDNNGYMQGNTCYRKIYQYKDSTEESLCCSTPLTPAGDQDECKIDAQRTSGETSQKIQACPDEGLVYCGDQSEKVQKYNSRWNAEKNECEYDFKTLPGNECADKSPGDVIEPGIGKEISSGEDEHLSEETSSCTEEEAKIPYIDSALRTNLLYYYAIITGTPEKCVKSDLNLPDFIYKDGVDGGVGRRLFTCSGKDGSIKFRVMSKDGSGLVQTTESFPTDPNDLNFPGYNQIKQAEEELNISLN